MATEIQLHIDKVNEYTLSERALAFLLVPILGWLVAFLSSPYLIYQHYFQRADALNSLKDKLVEQFGVEMDEETKKVVAQAKLLLSQNNIDLEEEAISSMMDKFEYSSEFCVYHGLARSSDEDIEFFKSLPKEGQKIFDVQIDLTKLTDLRKSLQVLDGNGTDVSRKIHEMLRGPVEAFYNAGLIYSSLMREFSSFSENKEIFAIYHGLVRSTEDVTQKGGCISPSDIEFFRSLPQELRIVHGTPIDPDRLDRLRGTLQVLDEKAMGGVQAVDTTIGQIFSLPLAQYSVGFCYIPTQKVFVRDFFLPYKGTPWFSVAVLKLTRDTSIEEILDRIPKVLEILAPYASRKNGKELVEGALAIVESTPSSFEEKFQKMKELLPYFERRASEDDTFMEQVRQCRGILEEIREHRESIRHW